MDFWDSIVGGIGDLYDDSLLEDGFDWIGDQFTSSDSVDSLASDSPSTTNLLTDTVADTAESSSGFWDDLFDDVFTGKNLLTGLSGIATYLQAKDKNKIANRQLERKFASEDQALAIRLAELNFAKEKALLDAQLRLGPSASGFRGSGGGGGRSSSVNNSALIANNSSTGTSLQNALNVLNSGYLSAFRR
jgi:hypothetical protein